MGRHWALPGGKAENVIITLAGQNEASKWNKLVNVNEGIKIIGTIDYKR
jgi:hypothetical protein